MPRRHGRRTLPCPPQLTRQPPGELPRHLGHALLVTVSDCVDTGPAPAPGNADPTPLNITSLTVYRPGRWYTCVGDWPEPVVPSPNSQRYVITGCALTWPSAVYRTVL